MPTKGLAPRVYQLESRNLDREFDRFLDECVENLEVPRFSEELKFVLKSYVLWSHIKQATSLGMQLYNINYETSSHDFRTKKPDRLRLVLLGCCNLVIPYLVKRHDAIRSNFLNSIPEHLKMPWLTLDNISLIFKSIGIINFLSFVKDGRFLHFQERVLGLTPVMSNEDYVRGDLINKAQMDLAYREKMWSVLAECLVTLVPYLNLVRIRNHLAKIVTYAPIIGSGIDLSHKFVSKENEKCAICSKQPFNAHVIGCPHVFCYYCIQSNYSCDPSNGYSCPVCKYTSHDSSQLRRYKLLTASQIK